MQSLVTWQATFPFNPFVWTQNKREIPLVWVRKWQCCPWNQFFVEFHEMVEWYFDKRLSSIPRWGSRYTWFAVTCLLLSNCWRYMLAFNTVTALNIFETSVIYVPKVVHGNQLDNHCSQMHGCLYLYYYHTHNMLCVFYILFWELVKQNNSWYDWPTADFFPSIYAADLNW